MNTELLTKFQQEIEDNASDMWPSQTGLPIHVWISENEGHKKHRPRLRVLEPNLNIVCSVSLEGPIEVLEGSIPDGAWQLLEQYIELNQEMLLMVWRGDLGLGTYYFLHQMVGRPTRAQNSRKESFNIYRKQILLEKSSDYHWGVTGVPCTIWITDSKSAQGHSDRPRLIVTDLDSGTAATITFDNEIEVSDGELPLDWFHQLERFIKLNRKLLLQRWTGEADSMDFIRRVKRIVQKPVKFIGVGNTIEATPYVLPDDY